jgi:uncharacterized coiled-coil protein SlyX
MFQDFQQQIFETRKIIRHHIHQNLLYDRCLEALKSERSGFRKAETRLKKVGFGFDTNKEVSLRYLFYEVLTIREKEEERRNLIYMKLNQMAGGRIIQYLTRRVDAFSELKSNIKAIETREKKLLQQIDKKVSSLDGANIRSFARFIYRIGDLDADLTEAQTTLELGKKVRDQLTELIQKLKEIDIWGFEEWMEDKGSQQDITNEVFDHSVNAHMLLCGFKNELHEFSEGRDLKLHLDAISGFKDVFFNNLIIDWMEGSKIKLSAFYARKTLNSLDALLQGLNSRIIKTESELSVTKQEFNALLKKVGQSY